MNSIHTLVEALDFSDQRNFIAALITTMVISMGFVASIIIIIFLRRWVLAAALVPTLTAMIVSIVLLSNNSTPYTDGQKQELIQLASESALLVLTKEQAKEILVYQVDQENYDRRNEKGRKGQTVFTSIKDVYGHEVQVVLVKTETTEATTTWVLKQFMEQKIDVSPKDISVDKDTK